MGSSHVCRGNSGREATFSNDVSKGEILTEDVIIFISLIFLNLHSCKYWFYVSSSVAWLGYIIIVSVSASILVCAT